MGLQMVDQSVTIAAPMTHGEKVAEGALLANL